MSEENAKEKCSYCHGSGRSPFSSSNPNSPFAGRCYLCKGSGYNSALSTVAEVAGEGMRGR